MLHELRARLFTVQRKGEPKHVSAGHGHISVHFYYMLSIDDETSQPQLFELVEIVV
jgi:hypothetical protein